MRLNREVAEGTRRLVEADAQAREELAAAQRELHKERAEINTHRDALEEERKQMARQRRTVSLWAPVVTGLASLLAITALGVFCWSLLFGLRHEDDPHEALSELLVSELLVEELTSPRPGLLSEPLADRSDPAMEPLHPTNPLPRRRPTLESRCRH